MFFNSGFQFNYNEPYAPSNFYKPAYFEDAFTGSRDFPSNSNSSTETQSSDSNSPDNGRNADVKETEIETIETTTTNDEEVIESTDPPVFGGSTARKPRNHDINSNELTGSDVSAGQLYESIERHLVE